MPAPNVAVPCLADLQAQYAANTIQIGTNQAQIDALQTSNDLLGIQQEWIASSIAQMQALTKLITPVNFTATSAIIAQIDLAWDNDASADTYILERSTAADFSTDLTEVYNGIYPTTYNDATVTSGVTYYYRIHATAPDLDDSDYAYDDCIAL